MNNKETLRIEIEGDDFQRGPSTVQFSAKKSIRVNPFDTSYHSYQSRSINNTLMSPGLKSKSVITQEKGITVLQAALSYISTLVGASIIALPYALL